MKGDQTADGAIAAARTTVARAPPDDDTCQGDHSALRNHSGRHSLKIACAQLNPIVGDLRGNCELVRAAADDALRAGADLLVTSELLVSGYPPKDLLLRE